MNWINKIKSPGQLSVLMDKLGKLDEFGLYQVSQLADRLDLVQEKTKSSSTCAPRAKGQGTSQD